MWIHCKKKAHRKRSLSTGTTQHKKLRKLGLDTYILNLDVVKAFDKMTPQLIFKMLLRIGIPSMLVDAIQHLYATRKLQFKVDDQIAQVPQSANRTLLMQGGALGPTVYKCLKLGIWISLNKPRCRIVSAS